MELRGFGVELRDFGCLKGVVLVWNLFVELRGIQVKLIKFGKLLYVRVFWFGHF